MRAAPETAVSAELPEARGLMKCWVPGKATGTRPTCAEPPHVLPGVGALVLAVLLQDGSLELGEVLRNATKMIKGSKGERGHMPY